MTTRLVCALAGFPAIKINEFIEILRRFGVVLTTRDTFVGKVSVAVTLLVLMLGMAGCGRSASAEELALQAAPKPSSFTDLSNVASRPQGPLKAPVFHQIV